MKQRWLGVALAILCLVAPVHADEAKKALAKKTDLKTFKVPYRLTDTNHVLVRAKINGKGPYHFIVDTGAPALFVGTAVCGKLGIKPDDKGWGQFDRFEIEGGVVIPKARGRIEDPFQLEGMNGLGLAGVHLDGIIGYNILASYRMEFDFTKDKLTWTELDFDPPLPKGLDGKATPGGGLDAIGTMMKLFGRFLNKKTDQKTVLKGFLGIELAENSDGGVEVKAVLAQGPAAAAGVKAGDRISHFQDREVSSRADIERMAGKLAAGETVKLTLIRGEETRKLTIKAGEGL